MERNRIKDTILYTLIVILILFLIFGAWKSHAERKRLEEIIQEGNKMIVQLDKTTKEGDGQYTKLVNYFNTEKDLNKDLKEQNKELYKLIKEQDEKLLILNNSIISLRGQLDEGFGSINEEDTNKIDIKLNYPNDEDNFITWDGFVNRENAFYKGEWKFGELPLQIIMTETNRGLWKSRLVGPKWLKVDSIEVNSLPLPIKKEESNLSLILGGGYINSFNNTTPNAVSIGAGIRFKDHQLIINGTTNQSIGFSYYYNILNFKKRK
jgi:hypothetical protein